MTDVTRVTHASARGNLTNRLVSGKQRALFSIGLTSASLDLVSMIYSRRMADPWLNQIQIEN